ncbi:MAG TPA: DinB family protein [Vicinamibacterales bacterium]|nr:DinB family protein [Vicinamibacterales bacterium]
MTAGQTFLEAARYFLGTEYRTQIRLSVEALTDEGLWWRANEQSNSVGNLLLHLNGNVRQWILAGVGKQADFRHRAAEFAARSGPPAAVLLADLDQTLDDVVRVLAGLSDEDLLTMRTIQGRDRSVLEAIFHVVEHFSQHLGQITLIAKLRAPGAINFYEDAGGLATPLWMAHIRR